MTVPDVRPLSLSLIAAQGRNDAMACGLIIFDPETDLQALALDLADIACGLIAKEKGRTT